MSNQSQETVIKSFDCLEGESVVDLRLSDHEPMVVDGVCTFNLMYKGWKVGSKTNNAFDLDETDDQYEKRLKKLLDVIEEIKEKYHVALFMFQEAPNVNKSGHRKRVGASAFYQRLKNIRGFENFNEETMVNQTEGINSSLCVVADKTIFPEVNNKTQTSIFNHIKGRFQEIECVRNDGTCVNFINIHGDMNKKSQTGNVIASALSQGYIVGGDFNITSGTSDLPSSYYGSIQKANAFSTVDGLCANQPINNLVKPTVMPKSPVPSGQPVHVQPKSNSLDNTTVLRNSHSDTITQQPRVQNPPAPINVEIFKSKYESEGWSVSKQLGKVHSPIVFEENRNNIVSPLHFQLTENKEVQASLSSHLTASIDGDRIKKLAQTMVNVYIYAHLLPNQRNISMAQIKAGLNNHTLQIPSLELHTESNANPKLVVEIKKVINDIYPLLLQENEETEEVIHLSPLLRP